MWLVLRNWLQSIETQISVIIHKKKIVEVLFKATSGVSLGVPGAFRGVGNIFPIKISTQKNKMISNELKWVAKKYIVTSKTLIKLK